MNDALIVIDVQNDYFEGGRFPLWETEAVLERTVAAIARARARGDLVVLVQHIVPASAGPGPFFDEGTEGAALHPALRAAAPEAPVVVKRHADSFQDTELGALLADHRIGRVQLAGMMTQNCVTFTALSKAAEAFKVEIRADLTTTRDPMIHQIALHALASRVAVSTGP